MYLPPNEQRMNGQRRGECAVPPCAHLGHHALRRLPAAVLRHLAALVGQQDEHGGRHVDDGGRRRPERLQLRQVALQTREAAHTIGQRRQITVQTKNCSNSKTSSCNFLRTRHSITQHLGFSTISYRQLRNIASVFILHNKSTAIAQHSSSTTSRQRSLQRSSPVTY